MTELYSPYEQVLTDPYDLDFELGQLVMTNEFTLKETEGDNDDEEEDDDGYRENPGEGNPPGPQPPIVR